MSCLHRRPTTWILTVAAAGNVTPDLLQELQQLAFQAGQMFSAVGIVLALCWNDPLVCCLDATPIRTLTSA